MKKLRILLLPAALVFAIAACKTQKTKTTVDECAGTPATYSADIRPIIEANCYKCHGVGSRKGDFTTYEGMKHIAASGDLEQHVLKLQDMPPKNPLPEAERKKIHCWLKNGFQDN